MPQSPDPKLGFKSLVELVSILRSPEGCPWDREQTHQSLVRFLLEEAYEAAEAIESKDPSAMQEELGDLLFQVILQAEIANQEQQFNIDEVIEKLTEKMIRRHPHVFEDRNTDDSEQVLSNWEKIKAAEKGGQKKLFDWPKALPALLRSHKIGIKARALGFDWDSANEVLLKVNEEWEELNQAVANRDELAIQEEFGDLFFALAQWARHLGLDAESLARQGNQKFERRFSNMVDQCDQQIEQFSKLNKQEKEKLWSAVKREESER